MLFRRFITTCLAVGAEDRKYSCRGKSVVIIIRPGSIRRERKNYSASTLKKIVDYIFCDSWVLKALDVVEGGYYLVLQDIGDL